MINVFLKKSSGFLIATFLCLTGAIAQNSPTTPNLRTESTRQSNAFRIISDLAGEATSESSNLASHEASELASKHNFITFFQGQYLHIANQPEEARLNHAHAIFERNISIDAAPCLKINAWVVDASNSGLELNVDWTGYSQLGNFSPQRQAYITDQAEQAGSEYLISHPGSVKGAAAMTIKRFHELLTLQITGCFYVNGQYVNQDDVVYIPVSDQKLNIRLIPFPKSQANNPNDSIINFTWDKASKRLLDRNNIHILEIDKHSSNGEGTIITATALHNGNTITASTRIVVVELDVDQKITNSTYAYDPNDDRHFHHYPTYNQNQVRGLPARFKYYPIPAIPNEDLPLIVKPRETPPNVLQYRTNGASFNLGVPQNGRAGEYTLNLNGIGGVVQGQHLIELMVGTQVARAVNVQRRNPYVIPVTFIQLTLRLPDGTNKTSNLTPNTYLNTTNEILARVGITIQPSNQVLAETIIDNDGILSYDPANLLASPEVTNFLANSPAINQCRQQNRMAIVMLPGLDRIVGVGGDNEVPGVAPRGGFVVFLNGGGTNRPSNTLAHEIGHAYFNLRHPFDEFQADHAQGEDTFNLMDYDHGRTQQYFRGYFFPSLNAANIIIR